MSGLGGRKEGEARLLADYFSIICYVLNEIYTWCSRSPGRLLGQAKRVMEENHEASSRKRHLNKVLNDVYEPSEGGRGYEKCRRSITCREMA